jgi:hypothetical protein
MTTSTSKFLLPVVVVLVTAIVLPGQTRPQDRTKSEAAFRQLASLVGDWEAVQDGVPIKETYTLTANGTALMSETKPANSPTMITMFTVDGDRLIATHYCSAGNQPQMVTGTIGDVEKQGVTFSLVRVTGMKTPDAWHNTGLTVTQRWNAPHVSRSPKLTKFLHFCDMSQ